MRAIDLERDVNVHLENRKKSRMFFWFIWIMYASVFMTKNCFNGALASIVTEGILTKSQTGLISAMFYLGYAPLQFVGGVVSDRYSPERLIKIGLLGAALSNAIIFFNKNYYVMLAAWTFNGMIQSAIWPSVFKIVSSQLVRSDRTQMTFYISLAATAGLLMSYLLAAVVPRWEYNFSISAGVLAFFAVALHFYEKYLNPYMKWDKGEADVDGDVLPKASPGISTTKILIASGYFSMLISTVLAIIVSQSRASLAPIMFVENYSSITPSIGNILNAVLIISGLAGTIFARQAVSRIHNEVIATIVTMVIMIPLLSVCIFVGKVSVIVIIAVLCVTVGLESVATLFRNYYNLYFVKFGRSGTVAGLMNTGAALSYLVAAYIMPLIVEKFGWQTLTILWPTLLAVAAVTLCFAVRKFNRFVEETF